MRHCVAHCDSWAPMKRVPSIEEQLSLFRPASSFCWRSSLFERFSGRAFKQVKPKCGSFRSIEGASLLSVSEHPENSG